MFTVTEAREGDNKDEETEGQTMVESEISAKSTGHTQCTVFHLLCPSSLHSPELVNSK